MVLKKKTILIVGLLMLLGADGFFARGETPMITIDDFESGLASPWEEKKFHGATHYEIVAMDGDHCLKAESHGSASGLIYRIRYNPKEYPILSWRWKVDGTLPSGDAMKKDGDDYAARVYVVFPHWIPMRTRSINYIWANRLPRGTEVPNTFYSRARMIALRSGDGEAGVWCSESRNVLEDYRRIFGDDPGTVGAIAIMTDTDNTGEIATAYYDDLQIAAPLQY